MYKISKMVARKLFRVYRVQKGGAVKERLREWVYAGCQCYIKVGDYLELEQIFYLCSDNNDNCDGCKLKVKCCRMFDTITSRSDYVPLKVSDLDNKRSSYSESPVLHGQAKEVLRHLSRL